MMRECRLKYARLGRSRSVAAQRGPPRQRRSLRRGCRRRGNGASKGPRGGERRERKRAAHRRGKKYAVSRRPGRRKHAGGRNERAPWGREQSSLLSPLSAAARPRRQQRARLKHRKPAAWRCRRNSRCGSHRRSSCRARQSHSAGREADGLTDRAAHRRRAAAYSAEGLRRLRRRLRCSLLLVRCLFSRALVAVFLRHKSAERLDSALSRKRKGTSLIFFGHG